jgi:hypothetical protein
MVYLLGATVSAQVADAVVCGEDAALLVWVEVVGW